MHVAGTAFAGRCAQYMAVGRVTVTGDPRLSSKVMLDVEMIDAVAPAAAIHVILFSAAATDRPAGLIAAMTEAVQFGTAHGGGPPIRRKSLGTRFARPSRHDRARLSTESLSSSTVS